MMMIVPKCLKCGNWMNRKLKEINGVWQTIYYCKECEKKCYSMPKTM
jgi:hypothetical protein